MVLAKTDDTEVRAHVQAGANLVVEDNLFWEFAETVAGNSEFNSDAHWFEFYVKPGITVRHQTGDKTAFYGGASVITSVTVGTDAFDAGNNGQTTVEELYLGLQSGEAKTGQIDLSFGAREWKAGTGMLLANGGSSGFSRGALKLGPRRAWRVAGLARGTVGGFTGTAFYLDPNEAPDNDTDTSMAGVDLRYDGASGNFAGVTLGKVVRSRAPYPKAAPNGIGVPSIIEGARDGLQFLTAYGRIAPSSGPLANAWLALDLALERNERIDLRAWAGRVQVGYTFASHRWRPSISYIYQSFSGDDPATSRLERFDPLYFEGNPSAWSTGSKSSMVFINSNVNAHQLVMSIAPGKRDTITARIARISANELLSPIQFGQATRLEFVDGIANPIAGVTRKHLSDDFYLEYSRVVTPNIYLTAGFSVSTPGAGINSIVPSVDAPHWTGGYVNLIVNY
ncbi:alginate export family protein [Sphingomonas koreensis]